MQILSISSSNESFRLIGAKGSVSVNKSYMDKHKPYSGGFYVLYEDGYESFSPEKPFNESCEAI